MRKLLTVCITGIMSCMGLPIWAADTQVPIDNLVQIVSENSATAFTVSWQNDTARKDYSVQYRQPGSTDVQSAYVTEPKRPPVYDSQNPPTNTYGAYIKKLKPDTSYEYRIRADGTATAWIPFKTTPEQLNHYKVLVFGDSQSVDYSIWGQTAQTAWKKTPDAAFFIMMGDITDNGQAWYQWRSWYENANVLTSHIPIAPVLGNHEAYSLHWKFAEPYTYKALFPVPYGGPRDQNRLAYSFDYGDVHYVSLNTDYEEIHENHPNMMENEAQWLDRDLAKATQNKKRIIVLMHRPPWDSPYHGVLDINGKTFMPIFDKYNVPLVFTAHEHCYARTSPVKNNRTAAAGTIYITTGRSGTETWDASVRKRFDEVYYNPMDMPMYLTLLVEPKDFVVTAYKTDGTVIDTTRIKTTI